MRLAAQADRDSDPLTIGGRISGDDGTIGSGQLVGGSEYGAGPPACGRQALSAGKSTADYDCRDAGRPVRSAEHRALGTAVERGNPGCAWHRASARPGALGVVRAV